MMNKIQTNREHGLGDTAVDGLLAGLVAGMGMAVYLLLTGLLMGRGLAEVFGLFDPAQAGNGLMGMLAHLAVSGIYGVFFALVMMGLSKVWPSILPMGWLVGLVYGLLLFGAARGLLLTAVDSPILEPQLRLTAVHFGIAHGVYGLVLGYWLGTK